MADYGQYQRIYQEKCSETDRKGAHLAVILREKPTDRETRIVFARFGLSPACRPEDRAVRSTYTRLFRK
jgi:hypothetical protein